MAQTPAIFRKEGDVIDYTPTSAVIAGEVVVIGSTPLIAPAAITANTLGVVSAEGVWDVPKTSDVFTVGDAVYWDVDGTPVTGTASTGAADNSAAAGELMGWATANAANTASYVSVKMTSAKRTATIAGSVSANDITGSDSSLGITGIAGNASAGGAIAIVGGAAAAGAYDGGAVTITGGAGPAAGNTGGAVTILSGAGDGTNGTAGAVILDSSGTGATKGAVTIGTNAVSVTLGKMPRVPFALVNAAGGNIATAAAVVEGWTKVAAADNAKGIQLPSCVNGAQCIIINQTTDKTLKIYPPTSKQINGAGANNAITLVANGTAMFASEGANAWYGGLISGIMS